MLTQTDGLVVNSTDSGESDKLLTLITERYGKMFVYARGGRRLNSKFMAASLKFTFGDFVMDKTDKLNILHEAAPKRSFFGLQKDITSLCLADYICEVLADTTMENEPSGKALPLALNCLYALSEKGYPPQDVKTVFELRMTEALGLNPDLSCCCRCGRSDREWYYLDVMNGELICHDCGVPSDDDRTRELTGTARIMILMSSAEVYAADRVIGADKSKMFSLPNDKALRRKLGEMSEKYLINHLEHNYKTLDFYKEMIKLG